MALLDSKLRLAFYRNRLNAQLTKLSEEVQSTINLSFGEYQQRTQAAFLSGGDSHRVIVAYYKGDAEFPFVLIEFGKDYACPMTGKGFDKEEYEKLMSSGLPNQTQAAVSQIFKQYHQDLMLSAMGIDSANEVIH